LQSGNTVHQSGKDRFLEGHMEMVSENAFVVEEKE
jgi:hypothetical protein